MVAIFEGLATLVRCSHDFNKSFHLHMAYVWPEKFKLKFEFELELVLELELELELYIAHVGPGETSSQII